MATSKHSKITTKKIVEEHGQTYEVITHQYGKLQDVFWKKFNGEALTTLHREHGPAVIWRDGSQFWYKNGEYHSSAGPALILSNGGKSWYFEGKLLSEKEWDLKISQEKFNII